MTHERGHARCCFVGSAALLFSKELVFGCIDVPGNEKKIAAGVPLFFRRAREEIEIFEVIKIGRKTWKNWEKTGQNWAKLGKTGENRVKLGKTGRNWAELDEIGRKTQQNCSKLFKTGENWGKLGRTGQNWAKLEKIEFR